MSLPKLPLLFCLLITLPLLSKGIQQRRMALVIGSSSVDYLSPLKDVKDMTATLQQLGFTVTPLTNADYQKMTAVINRFMGELKPNDEVVIYYSGFGTSIKHDCYLMPVDAKSKDGIYPNSTLISINYLLQKIGEKRCETAIVFYDASRKRSFDTTGFSDGELHIDSSLKNTYVFFGCGDDSNAYSERDRNSYFTGELIKHLKTPGIDLETIAKRTRQGVIKKSSDVYILQQPEMINRSVTPFYFLPAQPKRFALVIGNDKYKYSTKLNGQPYNDAQDVAKRLNDMGFQVSTATDANRQQMLDELDDFVLKAKGADLVMLYYSGHGIQDGNENYLVPIDARFITKSDIANRGISVSGLIGKLGSAKSKFSVIAMDACRSESVTIETSNTKDDIPKGFIPIRSDQLIESVYISLASRAGKPAYVNTNGRNGYFTEALLKHLQNGNRIESIFRAVSAEVEKMTNQQQQPEIIDRLKGDLEF